MSYEYVCVVDGEVVFPLYLVEFDVEKATECLRRGFPPTDRERGLECRKLSRFTLTRKGAVIYSEKELKDLLEVLAKLGLDVKITRLEYDEKVVEAVRGKRFSSRSEALAFINSLKK